MSATFSGSPAKATFQDLEGGSPAFQVQYNPKEFTVERQVEWGEHEESGQGQGALEFQKGNAMSVSMDLVFDTTGETGVGPARDVRTKWVNGLLHLTTPAVQAEGGEQEEEEDKRRPPKVLFSWGTFELTCVVESVSTTYLLFDGGGIPLRARCSIRLKEWTESEYAQATGGMRWAGNAIKLVKAKAGSLPSHVARETRTPWQKIAQDNNIDDPMEEFQAGADVVIVKP